MVKKCDSGCHTQCKWVWSHLAVKPVLFLLNIWYSSTGDSWALVVPGKAQWRCRCDPAKEQEQIWKSLRVHSSHAINWSVYSVLAVNSFDEAVSPTHGHFLHDTQAGGRAAAVAPVSAWIHQGVSSLGDGLNLLALSSYYCFWNNTLQKKFGFWFFLKITKLCVTGRPILHTEIQT